PPVTTSSTRTPTRPRSPAARTTSCSKRLSRRQNQLGSSNKKLRIAYSRVKDLTTRRLSLNKLPSEKVQFLVSTTFLCACR
uniref:Uncharacterized protein n=1 Tax=Triticum urartu TaxID=4572 RepID=A0A8R7QEN7_TRIUA